MDLKTSTRPRRQNAKLSSLPILLRSPDDGPPIAVLEVGPGLAVKYLGRLIDRDNFFWFGFKAIETVLRRSGLPDFAFETYEPHELVRSLSGFAFHLTLLDINPRVLSIVAESLLPRAIETVVADIGESDSPALTRLAGKFDLILAFSVIRRVRESNQPTAGNNLRRLAKPGGLLVSTDDLSASDCVPIPNFRGFFRRVEV